METTFFNRDLKTDFSTDRDNCNNSNNGNFYRERMTWKF